MKLWKINHQQRLTQRKLIWLLQKPKAYRKTNKALKLFTEWCDQEFQIVLYDYEVEISWWMLASLIIESFDIFIKCARQAGKTETVTHLVRFLIIFYRLILKSPLMAAFASPKGEQAKTDVDRIKKSILTLREGWQVEDRESNSKTIRAYRFNELVAEIFTFSLSPTTQNESKTLNLLVVEEAHNTDDTRRSD
jgi:hypothetical protein